MSTHYSRPPSAKVKNEWSYTSAPLICLQCCIKGQIYPSLTWEIYKIFWYCSLFLYALLRVKCIVMLSWRCLSCVVSCGLEWLEGLSIVIKIIASFGILVYKYCSSWTGVCLCVCVCPAPCLTSDFGIVLKF